MSIRFINKSDPFFLVLENLRNTNESLHVANDEIEAIINSVQAGILCLGKNFFGQDSSAGFNCAGFEKCSWASFFKEILVTDDAAFRYTKGINYIYLPTSS
ncbi:MAG TPA: hypothetical protein EYH36_07305 [Desulfocapsa sulfexigens]|nr:hypothetical protein [Desulfocapsa sulfexigens]